MRMALDEQQKEAVRQAFSQRVRNLREATGLSQDAFALEHGQHRTWIGHVERAERVPTLYGLVDLARAFGITPSALLDGIDYDALIDDDAAR